MSDRSVIRLFASLAVSGLISFGTSCLASEQPAEGASDTTAIVTGCVMRADTGQPLPGVVVHLAVPATDMRMIRTRPDSVQYEATTDVRGVYRLSVRTTESHSRASLDAFLPG